MTRRSVEPRYCQKLKEVRTKGYNDFISSIFSTAAKIVQVFGFEGNQKLKVCMKLFSASLCQEEFSMFPCIEFCFWSAMITEVP